MDEPALGDAPAMDAAAVAEAEAAAAALTGEPSAVELAEYADMAGLAEGQRVMLQLPAGERAGTESVIMEVVRVDGNQIHFIAPDPGPHGDSAAGHGEVKDEPTTLLELPEGTEFEDHSTEEVEFEDPGEETGEFEDPSTENVEYEDSNAEEMEEVPAEEIPRCFLCLRPASGIPLHSLVLERTSASSCSLAERICACAAPMRLDVSTADGVCEHCLQLVNAADEHLQQYEVMSSKIAELVRSADQRRTGAVANPASTAAAAAAAAGESDAEAEGGQEGTDGEAEGDIIKEEEGVEVGESDSDDSDWAPAGPTPRSTRSRVPKVRRRWSPEPIERPPHDGAPRGRGRPRKHPPPAPPPTVIEYSDLDTLKEQVKDIKTTKFNIKPAQPKRPLKSDLEKIIHLEVRAADGSPLGAVAGAGPRGRGRPPTASRAPTSAYECRRCDIQFQDSSEMVKHLRQHVSKPWCKRCRTEFPHRQAMLEHRRACRLRHRSGDCSICGRRVAFYRYHMRQHTDLVAQGLLEEGQAIPEEDDRPPPSAQKRVGKFLAGGVCSICGEHVPERLRKHERAHNITHTCPICKKVFTREDVVRGHIKRVHMKERPHVCAQCGKTFVSVYSLQRHEMIHKNEYRFYCQECGDGFRQKQQLTAHMRHKHGVVDVVFEDVQVMPEGAAVVDALSVITEPHEAVYEGAVLEADFDKEEYVITAAGDGDDVQFTAVADADGHLRLEA